MLIRDEPSWIYLDLFFLESFHGVTELAVQLVLWVWLCDLTVALHIGVIDQGFGNHENHDSKTRRKKELRGKVLTHKET